MPTDTDTQRTIDHTLDDAATDDATLPATPDEQLQAAIDMDKVREYTVRPGLLRVPVRELATARDGPKNMLQLDHPVIPDEDIRFFLDKPAYWDPHTQQWPKILNWYGYSTRNQYEIQTDRVYIRQTHDDEWELTKPPSDLRQYYWRWADALDHRLASGGRVARTLRAGYRVTTAPVRRLRRLSPAGRTASVFMAGAVMFLGSVAAMLDTSALYLSNVYFWAAAGTLLMMALCALIVEPPAGGSDRP